MNPTITALFDELEKISMSAKLLRSAANVAKSKAGLATKALHVAAPMQAMAAMRGRQTIPRLAIPALESRIGKLTGQADRFAQAAAART
jgi:hypothetical protein